MADTLNIGTLKAGQTATVTCTYKVETTDIGKGSLVNNAFVTSDHASASASAAAAKVEDVRFGMSMTKAPTTTPKDGVAYDSGETIRWNVGVENTGNQVLTAVSLSDSLSKATWTGGSTIPMMIPKQTVNKTVSYTVSDDDLGNGTIVNEAEAWYRSDITAKATSAAVPVANISNPFDNLTWAQIKAESAKAVSNKNAYMKWVGFSKAFTISGLGTFQAQLVAINNGHDTSSNTIGFTFLTEELAGPSSMAAVSTPIIWNQSLVYSYLNNNIYPNIESSLKSVLARTEVKFLSQVPTSSTTSFTYNYDAEYIWCPSFYELYGATGQDTHGGKEGEIFDIVKKDGFHTSDLRKHMYNVTSNTYKAWWTRSPYVNPQSGSSSFWGIGTSGGGGFYSNSSSNGIAFCFMV